MIYRRLGAKLVSTGHITEEQLNAALEMQKAQTGKRLDEILIEKGFVPSNVVYQTLEQQVGLKFIDLTVYELDRNLIRLVPMNMAKKYNVIPVELRDEVLYLAMLDPLNFLATDAVSQTIKRKVVPMLATMEGIKHAMDYLYGSVTAEKALQDMSGTGEEVFSEFETTVIDDVQEDAAPTIRLVNSFLEYAVNQNASDIHLEPRENAMIVRMRMDGILRKVFVVPRSNQNAVIARIKVMGNMNIAEHKIPLDGRSNVRIGEREIDLRISTLPTVYGEKVVIRLLYKTNSLLSMKGIGLSGKNLQKFESLLENSNGVILIVGPTGSGKSSSMYTMIGKLNTEQVNLVTLEDPVEYNFDGVNQVQINEKTGMTFASGLRSILRQDPDIIAVGEIRDGETADIAMRAAITGHLVLSTLHTNDAPSTIDRLLDMGVERFLISSALKGIISQRLVRRICPYCKEEYTPSSEEQQKLRLPYSPDRRFYRGKGCPRCFNTGYRGRTAVFEILVLNQAIRRGIADGLPHSQLRQLIDESDFEPLIHDCIRLVENGTTTVDEAYRTVNSTDV